MTHTLVLTSDGNVWGFGSNSSHELLLPSNIKFQTSPALLPIENIISVSFGDGYSLFLDHYGSVFSCGDNRFGRLGLTTSELANRNLQIPTFISSLHNIISISASPLHSLFLDSNGKVFSCGYNVFGQLGLNHTDHTSIPTLIPNLENIVAISAGWSHSLCLDFDGFVWVFGLNKYGQLGLNDNIDRLKPVRIEDLPTIRKISAGHIGDYTIMLDHRGAVWVCGYNYCGRLGLGNELDRYKPDEIKNLPKIISISAAHHSMMLDDNGEVWTCGPNYNGELCFDDRKNRNVPTKVKLDFRVSEIKAGFSTTLMIDEEGNLWGCGRNKSGRLGLEAIKETLVPIRIEGIEGEVHLEKMPESQRIPSALSYI